MKKVDYLIIGQGLAGSVLAYQLLEKNKHVAIVDSGSGKTASRQATGLVNPITGRRFVKSWMIDDLLPEAKQFYQQVAHSLGASFFKETYQYKVLQNVEQVNDFNARLQDDHYNKYIRKAKEKPSDAIIEDHTSAIIDPLLQINIPLMQDSFLAFFKTHCIMYDELVDYEKIECANNLYKYRDIEAEKIIFAEGFKLRFNPFFNYLPIRFAKGEALIIKCPQLHLEAVLNSKTSLTPLGEDLYYVGATYDWNDFEQQTSIAKRAYLIENLEKSIRADFEIIDQKVGIRPTVVDRRPLIGEHPSYKGMYVFNGLGTKGLSLAPYFAKQLVSHIEDGSALHSEVNISRVS